MREQPRALLFNTNQLFTDGQRAWLFSLKTNLLNCIMCIDWTRDKSAYYFVGDFKYNSNRQLKDIGKYN